MVDAVALVVFSLEAFMRCVSRGFVLGPYTYLRRSNWNKLDFLTVLTLFACSSSDYFLRSIRATDYARTQRIRPAAWHCPLDDGLVLPDIWHCVYSNVRGAALAAVRVG